MTIREPSNELEVLDLLHDGRVDAIAMRHAEALDKYRAFVFYVNKDFVTLRPIWISYGVLYLYELAELFPPAMSRLREMRDEIEVALSNRDTGNIRDQFAEYCAINRVLGEPSRTADMFVRIVQRAPGSEMHFIDLALESLVDIQQVDAYEKWLIDMALFVKWVSELETIQKYADEGRVGQAALDAAESGFAYNVSLLLVALARLNAKANADWIAERSLRLLSKSALVEMINEARLGKRPERHLAP